MEDVWDTVKIQGFFNTLIQPAQTEPVREVKVKRVKKEKIVLSEVELDLKKIEKKIAREKKRLAKMEEKVKIKTDKEEARKRKKLESEIRREAVRKVKKERGKSSSLIKPENSNVVTWLTATEEQRRFACYICEVFPRAGSFNRSELYRHYSLRHFSQQIKQTFITAQSLSLPCTCPFCPEDSGKYLSTGNSVTHLGQVHLLVERFLPSQYHVQGDPRRNVARAEIKTTDDNNIKLGDEKKMEAADNDLSNEPRMKLLSEGEFDKREIEIVNMNREEEKHQRRITSKQKRKRMSSPVVRRTRYRRAVAKY